MQMVSQSHIERQFKGGSEDFLRPMDDEIDNPQFLWGKGPEDFSKVRHLQIIL